MRVSTVPSALRKAQGASTVARRSRLVVSARAPVPFDEGADQVRRLLSRDKKELMGVEDVGSVWQKEFEASADATEQIKTRKMPLSASDLDRTTQAPNPFAAKASTASPFGGSSAPAAKSPFDSPAAPSAPAPAPRPISADPFAPSSAPFSSPPAANRLAEGGDSDREPWYAFLTRITPGQIFIVFSFSTIIGIMIATFNLVYAMGGIRLNE